MLDQRRGGRRGTAVTRSSGSSTKAAGSTFLLSRSVPLLAALVAVGGSLKANGDEPGGPSTKPNVHAA